MENVMIRNESYLVCATSPLLQAPAVSLAIKIKKNFRMKNVQTHLVPCKYKDIYSEGKAN